MTNKTTKKVLWIAVPLVVVLGAGAAAAGFKQHYGHPGAQRMVQRISDRLDLTPEQQTKLDAVKDAMVEGRRAFREERAKTFDKIIAEVRKSEMDEGAVLALVQERTSRIDMIAPRVAGPVIEFHKSLDDEQREKIVNLLEAMRDWGWGRRGHHG